MMMIAPKSRNMPVRIMSALAVAALLFSACVILISSNHSATEEPSVLMSAEQAADLKAKAAGTRAAQLRAHRERDATAALEKSTNQLRAQTDAAIASAKAQAVLLNKDKADVLAANQRTAASNAAFEAARLTEAAAVARTNMLKKVAAKARLQYAQMLQGTKSVHAVEVKSKEQTLAVNRNSQDAIQNALAAAKQFAKINAELAQQHKDGATEANNRQTAVALRALERIQHRQLRAGKHTKLAVKAASHVKRATPAVIPSKAAAPSKSDDDAEVSVSTSPVWPSAAQNGASDVAQAAINALNILGHGKLGTHRESITVLPLETCHDVNVGSSHKQRKRVRIVHKNLKCPHSVSKSNWITKGANFPDRFRISQSASGDSIVVDRLDKKQGWGMNLIIRCCNQQGNLIPSQITPSIAHVKDFKLIQPRVAPQLPSEKPLSVVNSCVTVAAGSSASDIKRAHAVPNGFVCPKKVTKANWATSDQYKLAHDVFDVTQTKDMTIVNRIDKRTGWGMDLKFKCCIPAPAPKTSPHTAPQSAAKSPSQPLKHHATSAIGQNAEQSADAARRALGALMDSAKATIKSQGAKASRPSSSPSSIATKPAIKSLVGKAPRSGAKASIDDDASNIDNFGLAGDLPAIRKEISASLADLNSDTVVKLSKKIEASLGKVQQLDVKGISKADVAAALAKAQAAAKEAAVSQDIANNARIAAAKSDAFLLDANKAKVDAVAKEQAASKAAAAATASASALKAKLAEATSTSLILAKNAQIAHASYLEAKKTAEFLKSKSSETAKASAAASAASKAAQLKAASAKESAKAATASLAASIKNLSEKDKKLKELNLVVEQARKARDVASAAAAKAMKEAQATKTLNSAKLAAAHKAAAAAEADLKAKIAAAAVASRNLRIAGSSRLRKQKLAVAADAAFVDAKSKFKALQEAATKSKKAAVSAESDSLKAAIAAKAALKVYLARRQSDLTWPGKKPLIA
jgi:hypothetical protein